MATLYGHLVNRNGKLAVCYTTTASDEPVYLHRYYLSDVRATDAMQEWVGRLVYSGRYDGNRWQIADSSLWIDVTGEVELEEEPIPEPRTKLPKRWNGLEQRWEKLSRREGWVPA